VKKLATLLLLVLAGSTAAQLHVSMQTYAPVIRVATPEGLTYTTQLQPASERAVCAAASKQFLASLKTQCPACEVRFARCERGLEGAVVADAVPRAASGESESLPVRHVVRTPGLHIDVAGAAEPARRACETIARSLARLGLQRADCYDRIGLPVGLTASGQPATMSSALK